MSQGKRKMQLPNFWDSGFFRPEDGEYRISIGKITDSARRLGKKDKDNEDIIH